MRYLDASYYNALTHFGIKDCVNLIELYIHHNPNISDINHCKQLQILDISGYGGITNNGMKNCVNLIKLYTWGNNKITDISHCKRLEHLETYGNVLENVLENQFERIKEERLNIN